MNRPPVALLVGLAVAASAAVTVGFLYVTRLARSELGVVQVVVTDDPPGGGDGAGRPRGTIHVVVGEGPVGQKGVVSPKAEAAGQVFYPVPYAHPPNLKLSAPTRTYAVTRQDEMGFAWAARPRADDFKDAGPKADEVLQKPFEALAGAALKPGLTFEDFAWEASGLRATRESLRQQVFEQNGVFDTVVGQEGEVTFPVPYAAAPNVELEGPTAAKNMTLVTASRPGGFRWKNVGAHEFTDTGKAKWRAKGVRAVEVPAPAGK